MNNVKNHNFQLLWLTIFAISMGFLETSVVVYLRELMYPAGFNFPLAPISSKLARVELLREAATLLMLLSAGWLAGRTRFEKFVLFLYTFAIWDIFYYIFLKLLIGWPATFFTWDILFLVPITWTGPVLAPLISSLSMMILAIITVNLINHGILVKINRMEWISLITGACLQFLAFIWDYSKYIFQYYSFNELWNLRGNKALYSLSINYVPVSFNWLLFLAGELFVIGSIYLFYSRYYRNLAQPG